MNTVLHMKRPRSRGHVTCDMCGNTAPRGVRYKRREMPDMWDDGVTADDIQEWVLQLGATS